MDTKAFWDTRLSEHWGLEGVGYLSLGQPFNVWMYRVRKVVFGRITKSIPAKKVCEIGPGTGFYTELLLKQGRDVTGIDLSPFAIEQLSIRFPNTRFKEGDVASGIEGVFDMVIAIDILFHILDDESYEKALRAIYEHLAPGGYFLFSENLPLHRVSVKHQVSRSEQEILALLERIGFTHVVRRPMFILMNAPTKRGATWWWRACVRLLSRIPAAGGVFGMLLFPVECLLTRFSSQTSSTEFVLCRKPLSL
ncbi:MAG: class I SAM-dependent methyltransferase [Minisyncoccia bacterium]